MGFMRVCIKAFHKSSTRVPTLRVPLGSLRLILRGQV